MQIEALLCPNPRCVEVSVPPTESFCGKCGHAIALDGKYRLVQELGEGGMGRTYLAQDLRFLGTPNERCVVKELKNELEDDPKAGVLLRREAGRLLDLRHPGVPSYRDFLSLTYNDRTYLFMVQQHIEGDDLQVLVDRDGPMPLERALPLMHEALDILHAMHTQRDAESGGLAPLLHLDFKPQNLMLREADQRLFLIDFGISVQLQMTMFATHGARISKGGFSPGFSPFEQTMGYVAPASDIFSWAMTFMVLLTGRLPTELLDPLSGAPLYQNHVSLPAPLDEIVGACLSTHMKDRPQSIEALRSLFEEGVADKTIPSMAAPSFEQIEEVQQHASKEALPTAARLDGWQSDLNLDGSATSERISSVRHLQRGQPAGSGGFVAPVQTPATRPPSKWRALWQVLVLLLLLGVGVVGSLWVVRGGLVTQESPSTLGLQGIVRSPARVRPLALAVDAARGEPTKDAATASTKDAATASTKEPPAARGQRVVVPQPRHKAPIRRPRVAPPTRRVRRRPVRRRARFFAPLPAPRFAGPQYGGGSMTVSIMGYRPERKVRLAHHARLRRTRLQARSCLLSWLLKDVSNNDVTVRTSALRLLGRMYDSKRCRSRVGHIAKFISSRLMKERESRTAVKIAQILGYYRCEARRVLSVMQKAYSARREPHIKRAIRNAYRRIQACVIAHKSDR